MKKYLVVLGASLLLSGCDYDFPKVDSGYVYQTEGGAPWVKKELTFLQVAAFSDWCANHRTGWTSEFSDIAPGTLVTFRHTGTDVVTANFVGSKVIVGGKSRALTAEEARALQTILDTKNG